MEGLVRMPATSLLRPRRKKASPQPCAPLVPRPLTRQCQQPMPSATRCVQRGAGRGARALAPGLRPRDTPVGRGRNHLPRAGACRSPALP